MPRVLPIAVAICGFLAGSVALTDELEIHYINVGQGGSTLIIGPDGTRILYDFGNVPGNRNIVPYLSSIGLSPGNDIDFSIVSHRGQDHYFGYLGVIRAGYDVTVANYDSGSTKTSATIRRQWLNPAEDETSAGAVQAIPVGLRIPLGDGAEAIVLAANGRVVGRRRAIPIENENDRSISLLITYNGFQYIIDGDLGAGEEECASRDTDQVDIQAPAVGAAIREGLLDPDFGVDVLHIAHHGSESSTSAAYFNAVIPEIAVMSVGVDQSLSYKHPREDIVEGILLGNSNGERAPCVTAPPVIAAYQTEDGWEGQSSTGKTSNAGLSVGDIVIRSDGLSYAITGNNRVHCKTRGDEQRCSSQEAPADGRLIERDVDYVPQ